MKKNGVVSDFVRQKNIAFFGLSRNQDKFGNYVYKELKKKDYNLFGIHPELDSFGEDKCYPDLFSLPVKPEAAFVCVKTEHTLSLAREVVEAGIKHIWFQQGTGSEDTITYCREKGVEPVTGECILMYAQPVESFHAFHRWLWKLIGKLKT